MDLVNSIPAIVGFIGVMFWMLLAFLVVNFFIRMAGRSTKKTINIFK